MSWFWFALVMILVSGSQITSTIRNNRSQDGLIGPVRSVLTEEARLSNNDGKWIEISRVSVAMDTYDVKGRAIERIGYDKKGNLLWKRVSKYDSQGFKKSETQYDAESNIQEQLIYMNDTKGRVISAISKTGTHSHNRITYKYDGRGNKSEEAYYNADGSLYEKYIYTHRGNEMEWMAYKADGSPSSKFIHTYDANGNEIGKTIYHANGLLYRKWIIAYDKYGNRTEEAIYNSNMVLEVKYVYRYEFDSTGNWIKRIWSKRIDVDGQTSFEPYEVLYRKITYY